MSRPAAQKAMDGAGTAAWASAMAGQAGLRDIKNAGTSWDFRGTFWDCPGILWEHQGFYWGYMKCNVVNPVGEAVIHEGITKSSGWCMHD